MHPHPFTLALLALSFSITLCGVPAYSGDPPAPKASSAPSHASPSTTALFAQALDSRFNLDCSQRVRLTTRSRAGAESYRLIELALKQIDGRLHALAEIVEPEHLRGTRVLSIEATERNDDQFVYMPSNARVRRISGAQRADLFFGTDVTLEDFERHYASEFEIADAGSASFRDEPVRLVSARPKFSSNYDSALYSIGADGMALEIRYLRDGKEKPVRVVRATRSTDPAWATPSVPAVLEIENVRRGTTTTVDFEKVVARAAPTRLFTTDALESSRSIPFLDEGG